MPCPHVHTHTLIVEKGREKQGDELIYHSCIHNNVCRHITSERFIVEPRGGDTTELLIIDRVTQEITLQGRGECVCLCIHI